MGYFILLAIIVLPLMVVFYGLLMSVVDKAQKRPAGIINWSWKAPWKVALWFVILSLALFIWEMEDWHKSDVTKSWPTTKGIVLKSWGEAGRRKTSVIYHCQYSYTIDGREYTSSQIHVNDEIASSKLQKGTEITVHYNPDNPRDAILDTTLIFNAKGSWSLLCLVVASLAFGAGFASNFNTESGTTKKKTLP